jgi:hypothetical protein
MKREIEEKGMLPDSQPGFRKGRGHLAKSELKKKEGRMCALQAHYRAAFDKVDKEKILECRERERGISE